MLVGLVGVDGKKSSFLPRHRKTVLQDPPKPERESRVKQDLH